MAGDGHGVRLMPPPASALQEQPTDSEPAPSWHTLSVEGAITQLATPPLGCERRGGTRLRLHGPNELRSIGRSCLGTLAAQFKNALIIICCAQRHSDLGHTLEALVITVIVLFAGCSDSLRSTAPAARSKTRQMAAPLARCCATARTNRTATRSCPW